MKYGLKKKLIKVLKCEVLKSCSSVNVGSSLRTFFSNMIDLSFSFEFEYPQVTKEDSSY